MTPGSSRARALLAAAALLVLLGGGLLLLDGCRSGGGRQDIVLVVWDTCRGDRVEAAGYGRPNTPRLKEIAASGVVFRRAFTPSPWTPPAHGSLFTGLLPRRHGLREGKGDRVRQGIPLLASTLRDAGYQTVAFVTNPQISDVTGLVSGFDTVFRVYDPGIGKGTGGELLAHVESWVARLRASGERTKPLFVFVNVMDTHLPYTFEAAAVALVHGDGAVNAARVAAGAVDERRANAITCGAVPLDPALPGPLSHAYDGAVCLADRATGEILDLLGGVGIGPEDFVAVCGDHGENLGEHGELGHIYSLHEPVLHVPMVVRWPGRLDGGRREDAQVRLQDIYLTVLAAAEVDAPEACGKDAERLDAAPLRPRLVVAEYGPPLEFLEESRPTIPGAPDSVFERFHLELLAVREPDGPGARKYLRVTRHAPGAAPVLHREALYDLEADPGENRSLLEGGGPEERASADRLHALGQ